ncbi:hypothetical protein, partial [Vibrio harveyi]
MKKSLKDGETLCRSITYSQRGPEAASFKAFSIGKVCEEKAKASLKESLDETCLKCPYIMMNERHETKWHSAPGEAVVTATARCTVVGRCVAEVEDELPVYEREYPSGEMAISFEDDRR